MSGFRKFCIPQLLFLTSAPKDLVAILDLLDQLIQAIALNFHFP